MCIMQVAARKQHPCPSNTRRWFRQFLVIYRCLDKGGGGDMCPNGVPVHMERGNNDDFSDLE